ncbi:MAG: DUF4340 domain-containing protein [Arenimonas sp.]
MGYFRFIAVLFLLLIGGCRENTGLQQPEKRLLPEFSSRQKQLQAIHLLVAENKVAVKLSRSGSAWWVLERNWPADPKKIADLLDSLAKARLEEAKTKRPERYQYLGLEDLSDPDAQGVELQLQYPDRRQSILFGKLDLMNQKSYARLANDPQSWRLDRAVALSKNPDDWLQREIIDVPLARISHVVVKSSTGPEFKLLRDSDHFAVLEGGSHDRQFRQNGDDLAGVLQALAFDELQQVDSSKTPERELEFHGFDGFIVVVSAWRDQARVSIRMNTRFDEQQARAFLAGKKTDEQQIETQISAQKKYSEELNRRFQSRQFLLPNETAAKLLLGRQQLLSKP